MTLILSAQGSTLDVRPVYERSIPRTEIINIFIMVVDL